jgi:hypothetical protein
MSPIRGSHHLTRTVAFDFAGCLTRRTLHIVALVGDVTAFELNRGGLGDDRSVRGGLVAVEDQVTLHASLLTAITGLPCVRSNILGKRTVTIY